MFNSIKFSHEVTNIDDISSFNSTLAKAKLINSSCLFTSTKEKEGSSDVRLGQLRDFFGGNMNVFIHFYKY